MNTEYFIVITQKYPFKCKASNLFPPDNAGNIDQSLILSPNHFQPCNRDSIDANCENFYAAAQSYQQPGISPWKLVQSRLFNSHKRKKCRLELANVTREDEGLYRCVLEGSVLKSFELEVQGEAIDGLALSG